MKLILENWQKYLNENIDPRIQNIDPRIKRRVDIVLGISPMPESDEPLDDIVIKMEREEPATVEFYYAHHNKETGEIKDLGWEPAAGWEQDNYGSYPWGSIKINKKRIRGLCLNGWAVELTSARKGFGPLLYEVAMEWASQEENGFGLMSGRRTVSAEATKVWQTYLERSDDDIEVHQLDTLTTDPDRGIKKRTPDNPKDDCFQTKAIKVGNEKWHETPYAKLYRKADKSVMDALGDKLIYETTL